MASVVSILAVVFSGRYDTDRQTNQSLVIAYVAPTLSTGLSELSVDTVLVLGKPPPSTWVWNVLLVIFSSVNQV